MEGGVEDTTTSSSVGNRGKLFALRTDDERFRLKLLLKEAREKPRLKRPVCVE